MAYAIRAKDEFSSILAFSPDAVVIVEGHWHFQPAHVNLMFLKPNSRAFVCPYKGQAIWYDLMIPGLTVENIAWVYPNPKPGFEQIKGLIGFYSRETSGTIAQQESGAAV